MRITVADYLRYAWQMLTGYRANIERRIFAERRQDIANYLDVHNPLTVLDLGNGHLRPQYSLLKAAGHRVYGVDFANRPQWDLNHFAYGFARAIYRWKLDLPSWGVDQTLVCADVNDLPFPDNAFELITSVAAFEHFMNVPAVLVELHRVVKPGGLVYACIHLFTCPSGGHNVRVSEVPLRRLPKGVDPWDHLRKRRLPFHVPLNEWRRGQYLAAFQEHFQVLKHYCATREGEHLLTPEIESELSDFSREELTCGAYVIVARKPA